GSPPLDLERLKEPIHQHRHAEHRVKQAQRLAPLRMRGETRQRLGHQWVVPKQRSTDAEPRAERLSTAADRRAQRLVELIRVVHEVAGMDAEEASQQETGLVRHVAASTPL